jgi:hypothetical protein
VITFVCAPAAPWEVAVYGDTAGADPSKYDTAGSELDFAAGTTDNTIDVAVTIGPLWSTDAAEDPFEIIVGGEVMTVTDVQLVSSPQLFVVTRSVNGVVKAHDAGAPVRLFRTPRYGL